MAADFVEADGMFFGLIGIFLLGFFDGADLGAIFDYDFVPDAEGWVGRFIFMFVRGGVFGRPQFDVVAIEAAHGHEDP